MHKKPGKFGLTKQERTAEMSIETKTNIKEVAAIQKQKWKCNCKHIPVE